MQFDQMVPPNVEIMLLLDNIQAVTITGMILLLRHHQTIQTIPTIPTMLPMCLKLVSIDQV